MGFPKATNHKTQKLKHLKNLLWNLKKCLNKIMATLIILKRRIKTTRNVSKTTKAMQLISASKLKRAQDAAMLSKPYVQKLDELSKRLSRKIDKENINEYMIKPDNTNSKLIIVVSHDKGLSGGLVTNIIKEALVIEYKNK